MITSTLLIIAQAVLVPALSPLCIGIIRKTKAVMQNRIGASIFQPYRDLNKLFHKDEVVSTDATFIFRAAPFIVFATTLVVAVSIPLLGTFIPHLGTSDLLAVLYTLALGTFFLALGGIDVGGPFGGFGASREMTLASLAEAGLLLSLFAVARIAGTTDLISIPHALLALTHPALLTAALAFFGFFVALLVENARYPFDNPATHLELTMVHEAMLIEYSGKRLGLMEWAAANKLFIFIVLGANLFFPWGVAATLTARTIALSLGLLFVKAFFFCFAIAFLESTVAKLRLFRLPDLLLLSFIASCVAIIFTL